LTMEIESREAGKEYATKYRGMKQDELQPHTQQGEEIFESSGLGQYCSKKLDAEPEGVAEEK